MYFIFYLGQGFILIPRRGDTWQDKSLTLSQIVTARVISYQSMQKFDGIQYQSISHLIYSHVSYSILILQVSFLPAGPDNLQNVGVKSFEKSNK